MRFMLYSMAKIQTRVENLKSYLPDLPLGWLAVVILSYSWTFYVNHLYHTHLHTKTFGPSDGISKALKNNFILGYKKEETYWYFLFDLTTEYMSPFIYWLEICSTLLIKVYDLRYVVKSPLSVPHGIPMRKLHAVAWLAGCNCMRPQVSDCLSMMTSSNGNIFRVTGPLCGEFTGPGEFPTQGQWRGALMFSLICVWINGWGDNHEAGDLRRHRGHYDVNVMHPAACVCTMAIDKGLIIAIRWFPRCNIYFHNRLIRL